jgi:ribose 5-phosphate isomerase B
MRIALGADHRGYALKEEIKRLLDDLSLQYEDFGTSSPDAADYPDFAAQVARGVTSGRFDRGILVCATGIGMAIAANKVRGVRAATVGDVETARLSREHNDANVLALGARATSPERAREIIRAFLETPFAGGRHQGRVDKITEIERAAERVTDHARS